ncbi:hypothetical protein EIN_327360 [Entamoeba invadens IP1]|uniref:TLDc domain-containing protein n=1 Tax=Entamoeba invadens IP1 TaxID=370355 RepID=A0A0A1TXK8_ENTIV|nr:hypothetical protein EIN_327360 [Entamoeba invadens IP1]ELP86089.1 hypothetical protein EIN_327360 [Entamoeba invadens IP1]|eukprot:XP_004185435.1 hypothetical protein EIN_327360 [Entamoeba invadens IP1]
MNGSDSKQRDITVQDFKVETLLKLANGIHKNPLQSVVYDSNVDEWSSELVKKKVNTYTNITLFVFTNSDYVFGLHANDIRLAQQNSFSESSSHFLFTYKNTLKGLSQDEMAKGNILPKIIHPKRFSQSTLLFSDTKAQLFQTGAFIIQLDNTHNTSFIDNNMFLRYTNVERQDFVPDKMYFFGTLRVVLIASYNWR